MHTEYIVSSRNLHKTLPVPLWSMMFSFISFCVFCTFGHKSIWCVLNVSLIFEISVRNQLERGPIWKETIKNYFNKGKTHPLSKSATKRIKQVHIVPFQLSPKKAMFLDQRVCGLYVKYPYLTSEGLIIFWKIKGPKTIVAETLWSGNIAFCNAFWQRVFFYFVQIIFTCFYQLH